MAAVVAWCKRFWVTSQSCTFMALLQRGQCMTLQGNWPPALIAFSPNDWDARPRQRSNTSRQDSFRTYSRRHKFRKLEKQLPDTKEGSVERRGHSTARAVRYGK